MKINKCVWVVLFISVNLYVNAEYKTSASIVADVEKSDKTGASYQSEEMYAPAGMARSGVQYAPQGKRPPMQYVPSSGANKDLSKPTTNDASVSAVSHIYSQRDYERDKIEKGEKAARGHVENE